MNKYRKKTIVILSIVGILLGMGLAVNWYITNRLEAKIAAILIRNIEQATGGLYTLTYDKLSVGFYDGELSIHNLHFFPDSTVYTAWEDNDSLPKEVIDLQFKQIHFKGVNLKMIRRNRDLRFTFFDIIEPKVKIIAPQATAKTKKTEPTHIDDPYQLIRNHLKAIRVNELHLKNAEVKYIVEDSVKSAIYAIDNTDFSIYNFHLDKNSYKDGKLLFSDNISFKINTPQVLLSNDEFNLSIKGLELSTKDSIIKIKGVNLESAKNSLTKQSRELNAELDQIAFQGISLSRINEDRILSARRFTISAPIIKMNYHPLSSDEKEKEPQIKESIIVQSASLYDIVSPILAKIQIDTIAINKANFDYTVSNERSNSTYSFNNLNFLAEKFIIDSSYISKYNFIHCDEFNLEAKNLQASIAELNYKMNIGSFFFDTKKNQLSIENIKLNPLYNAKNSVSGTIGKVVSSDLALTGNAISARSLFISQPNVLIKSKKVEENKSIASQPKAKSPKLGVSILLDRIKLDNGYLKWEQDSDSYFADNVNMSIYNFSFHNDFYIKDLVTKISHIGGKINNKTPASFEASNVNYSSIDKNLDVSSLKYESNSLSVAAEKFNAEHLSFSGTKQDSIYTKNISLSAVTLNNKDLNFNSPSIVLSGFTWANKEGKIDYLQTSHPLFSYLSRELEVKTVLEELNLENIIYSNNELTINKNILKSPQIYLSFSQGEKKKRDPAKVSLEKIRLGEVSIDNGNLQIENIRSYFDEIAGINILAKELEFSPNSQLLDYKNVSCTVPNLSFPLDNGFYTLSSEKIAVNIDPSHINIEVKDINMKSRYPKFQFAHHHPKHKDWFGLKVGSIKLDGIKINDLKKDKISAQNLFVNDTYLENLKNQNIKIQHNLMPMIYEVIQNFPKEFKITNTNISNFNVAYEEIANRKEIPGKIFFTRMNGKVSNFTNVADYKDQYLDIYANGYLMGTGYFDALWQIPVSSEHDNFNLKAKLSDFDLKELNQLITPMAPASINSGYLSSIDFSTSASSKGAHIHMTFLYENLNISLWQQKNDKIKNKNLYSKAVNLLLKNDNKIGTKNPTRIANLNVERDPYHSTFNYFWQILQPAVAESVGVTEKRQNRLKKVGHIFNNIKNFFSPKKENEDSDKN